MSATISLPGSVTREQITAACAALGISVDVVSVDRVTITPDGVTIEGPARGVHAERDPEALARWTLTIAVGVPIPTRKPGLTPAEQAEQVRRYVDEAARVARVVRAANHQPQDEA